jgi:hypothetical protein
MNSRVMNQFKNYLDVANAYKQNANIYFFIKNYAFMKAYNVLSKDYSGVSENEMMEFNKMNEEYKNERTQAKWSYVMSKEEYKNFLEDFFSRIDFDKANPGLLALSRDLTEILGVFGEYDELTKKRSKFIRCIYLIN